MINRVRSSQLHLTELITQFNIDKYFHDVEIALHLPSATISAVFSDESMIAFRHTLDQMLADCINISTKSIRNAVSFHCHEGEDIDLYFMRMKLKLDILLENTIAQLKAKHGQLITEYEATVSQVRNELRCGKGYNEAVLLNDLRISIIIAIQNSSHISDAHVLDDCLEGDLDTFQKKLAKLMGALKHHKKQVIHDIKKQVERVHEHHAGILKKNESLLFHDKHAINFTPKAYQLEFLANNAIAKIKDLVALLKVRSDSSIRYFEKELFLQCHFKKIQRSTSDVICGLQPFRELVLYKNRIFTLLAQDRNEIDAMLAREKIDNPDGLQAYAYFKDKLDGLDAALSQSFLLALNQELTTAEIMQRFAGIEESRIVLRRELADLANMKSSSTAAIYKKLNLSDSLSSVCCESLHDCSPAQAVNNTRNQIADQTSPVEAIFRIQDGRI